MSTGVGARIVQLVGTLVLTHFIAPGEYGEISAAAICTQTAAQLTNFSFGQYLIARRAPADVGYQAAKLHVGLGVVAMIVVYLLRGPLGGMVDAPAMGRFVPGFAAAILLDRLRYVPERLLVRALRFRTVALVNGAGELLFTAVAVSLAPRYGGAAVVAGTLARSLLQAILFIRFAPRDEWLVRSPLRADAVRGLFGYGVPIMIAALSDLAASRWDNLIISRLFGPSVMGRYNLAYSLAETPISYVAEHIGDVLMPSYSKMEPAQRRAAVVRAAGLMGLIVSPLGFGLGAVAPTVVQTFFDPRWALMAPMLAILSVMTVFRPLTWSASAFLQAQQRVRIIMVTSFLRTAVLLTLVAVLGKLGGPLWACGAAGASFAIHAVVVVIVAGRVEGIAAGAYLLGVARPLAACVPMFVVVVLVARALAAAGVPGALSLVVQVLVGAAVYVGAAWVFAAPLVRELLALLRRTLRQKD